MGKSISDDQIFGSIWAASFTHTPNRTENKNNPNGTIISFVIVIEWVWTEGEGKKGESNRLNDCNQKCPFPLWQCNNLMGKGRKKNKDKQIYHKKNNGNMENGWIIVLVQINNGSTKQPITQYHRCPKGMRIILELSSCGVALCCKTTSTLGGICSRWIFLCVRCLCWIPWKLQRNWAGSTCEGFSHPEGVLGTERNVMICTNFIHIFALALDDTQTYTESSQIHTVPLW